MKIVAILDDGSEVSCMRTSDAREAEEEVELMCVRGYIKVEKEDATTSFYPIHRIKEFRTGY
jgi:hypothetical protein